MFENRVPHMLDNDYTPYSALDIFVKDLVRPIFVLFTLLPSYLMQQHQLPKFVICNQLQGIVSRESSAHKVPLHVATVAYQLFVSGAAATPVAWPCHPVFTCSFRELISGCRKCAFLFKEFLSFSISLKYSCSLYEINTPSSLQCYFGAGSAAGWGRQDDAGVVKVQGENLTAIASHIRVLFS